MPDTKPLGELLSTLFDRRPFNRKVEDQRPLIDLCQELLAKKAEASGVPLAAAILEKYRQTSEDEKLEFFTFLNDTLDIDSERLAALAMAYAADVSAQNFADVSRAAESRRRHLLGRLNQAPGATAELVRMRKDLLRLLKSTPALKRTDLDFIHLFRGWFNRGFLVLRQITWDSSAAILEKIIAYEAVHEISTWDDLRRRLLPPDRRCFAFFHPAMPEEPLIFVEVALSKGIPNSIQQVLSDEREELNESQIDTAVFYSISNCQDGLAGISFGSSLIKQVVHDLSHELDGIKNYVTLSPIPNLMKWIDELEMDAADISPDQYLSLAAHYLLKEKTPDGRPLDPVARFHLGNGAQIHAVHAGADVSENGLATSNGIMVNYLYDLTRIAKNLQLLEERDEIAASPALKALARQAKISQIPPKK